MQQMKLFLQKLSAQNYEGLDNYLRNAEAQSLSLEREILTLLKEERMHDFYYIYLCSYLLNCYSRVEYLELILEAISVSDMYNVLQKRFLLDQIEAYRFRNPLVTSELCDKLEQKIYDEVVAELQGKIKVTVAKKECRNPKEVVVLTDYFLSEKHAPTHSTLERCYTLQKKCGKNVSIVSIAENIPGATVPYYNVIYPNVVDILDGLHTYVYKGEEFTIYQSKWQDNEMERYQEIVSYVEKINPYYIVYVGNRNPIADLLNQYCPVVTVATIFSKLPQSRTAFAMLGRNATEEEHKKSSYEIVEVPFTFELTEKLRDYTRKELCIPKDKFVMAVVGNRLDADVTDEFLAYMKKIENGFLLFLGSFHTYEEKKQKFSYLEDRSLSMGQVKDVVGILECADIYVNPKRQGGGFSVIEAFHVGIPAVSIAYGDVYAAAGADFCVNSYEEMVEEIERYFSDKEYYEQKSMRAKEREKEMTNGAEVFADGIQQMLASKKFY